MFSYANIYFICEVAYGDMFEPNPALVAYIPVAYKKGVAGCEKIKDVYIWRAESDFITIYAL